MQTCITRKLHGWIPGHDRTFNSVNGTGGLLPQTPYPSSRRKPGCSSLAAFSTHAGFNLESTRRSSQVPDMARQESCSSRLKKKLKDALDDHSEPSRIRIHRAISWLARAEAETDDHDARFIFLWVAFNAACAREFELEDTAREQLNEFFARLLELDVDRRLAKLLISQFSGPIRTTIANKFVFAAF